MSRLESTERASRRSHAQGRKFAWRSAPVLGLAALSHAITRLVGVFAGDSALENARD